MMKNKDALDALDRLWDLILKNTDDHDELHLVMGGYVGKIKAALSPETQGEAALQNNAQGDVEYHRLEQFEIDLKAQIENDYPKNHRAVITGLEITLNELERQGFIAAAPQPKWDVEFKDGNRTVTMRGVDDKTVTYHWNDDGFYKNCKPQDVDVNILEALIIRGWTLNARKKNATFGSVAKATAAAIMDYIAAAPQPKGE